jgi:hypothetical protein
VPDASMRFKGIDMLLLELTECTSIILGSPLCMTESSGFHVDCHAILRWQANPRESEDEDGNEVAFRPSLYCNYTRVCVS